MRFLTKRPIICHMDDFSHVEIITLAKQLLAFGETLQIRDELTKLDALSRQEQKIYIEMRRRANGFISRDEIATILWKEESYDDKYSDWAIDKMISRLREKLILGGLTAYNIKTLRGKGYQLNPT